MKRRIFVCLIIANAISFVCFIIRRRGTISQSQHTRPPKVASEVIPPTKADATTQSIKWRGVLIQSNFRSGSSFFGELFNQRDDVYYSYEPLVNAKKGNTTEIINTLKGTFSCNINDASNFEYSRDPYLSRQCKRNNVCFRNRMKALCSKGLCTQPESCTECSPLNSFVMSKICEAKKLTASKVIRLPSLQLAEPLMNDARFDLKVIHLVRDPRGIMSSRMNLAQSVDMKSTCRKILRNVQMGLEHTPYWLRGRYLLIRYEDLALDPYNSMQKAYDFVGLETTGEMREWLRINTMGITRLTSDPKAQLLWDIRRRQRQTIPAVKFEKLILSHAFTTIRQSNATWWAWVNSLDRKAIESVQKDCGEVMDLLGYKIINSTEEISRFSILNELANIATGRHRTSVVV